MKKISLVCLAAGMSKRFGGGLKQMIKVGPKGETLIEYILEKAAVPGIERIIIIVREETKLEFEKIFKDKFMGIPVIYAIQEFDQNKRTKPWGTIEAICCVKPFIEGPFIVCNSDDICTKEQFLNMMNHIQNKSTEATIAYKLKNCLPEKGEVTRGIFKLDKKKNINSIEERFKISLENFSSKGLSEESLCNVNLFGFHKSILPLLEEKLNKFKEKNLENPDIECLLTVELNDLIKEKKIQIESYVTNEEWMGITNKEDEEKVRKKIKKDNKK